jgi:rhomboid protease GluP
MLWVRQLGPATAEIFGPGRMIIIYTVSGVCGFALSSFAGAYVRLPLLQGAGFTVGASASIFGLLGALVFYGRKSGSTHIRGQAVSYALMLFVFGFIMRGVDNYAHAGGFAGGYMAAVLLDPLREERLEHIITGLICIGVTAGAIIWSVDDGIAWLR